MTFDKSTIKMNETIYKPDIFHTKNPILQKIKISGLLSNSKKTTRGG